ncbi:MAG: TRAP transporter substrate-binding protein DctP [Gammaproteobacteria bacterium]|nr:MAG: TRAP transporter substrate-binding protein DctP [Gammaproteobacteria bacterium]
MKRRDFLCKAGAGALVTGAVLSGCNTGTQNDEPAISKDATQAPAQPAQVLEWKMVTTWPKDFPALGTGANLLAELITQMSGGRINVKVYGAGELVPAFEVFDAVSSGTAHIGHGAAYYWKGKIEAAQFFSTVPFGFTALEMNAWLHHGGAAAMWEELYEPFGLVPMAAGNTGVQMGGWFNKKINTLADLNGLKMRIPGLGGEVLRRAGGTPVNLPGGELFMALQSGAIDATEWVGPYNDLAFGLHKAAKYYYYPGWHEPGTTLECIVNKTVFNSLPDDLKAIVRGASRIVNEDMLSELTARNNAALKTLTEEYKVDVRRFPDEVLDKLKKLSFEVVAEVADKDPFARKVYDSYLAFRDQVTAWHEISERAYMNARSGLA